MKKICGFLIVVLITLGACGTNDTASYETIDIHQIEEKVQDGYKVLDVRETSEYDSGHIVGAENKPLSELQNNNIEGLNKKDSYIIICQSGNRSKQASQILLDKGYTLLNVSEGMSSWTGEVE